MEETTFLFIFIFWVNLFHILYYSNFSLYLKEIIILVLTEWGVKYEKMCFLPFSAARYQTSLTMVLEKQWENTKGVLLGIEFLACLP